MKTTRQITLAVASFALTAALVAPLAAHAEEAAPIALVRPGDRDMTCAALATEINQLAAASPVAQAKPKKKKGGFGFLKALSAASPLLGQFGGGGVLGSVASQAAGMAQQEAMQSQMSNASDAALGALNPQASIEAQRKDRLTAIFEEKRC